MKRTLKSFALMAVAALGAVACTETDVEEAVATPEAAVNTTIYASTPSEQTTKVTFNDQDESIYLWWELGDEITIYNGDTSLGTLTCDDLEKGQFSSNTLTLTDGETYTAVYGSADNIAEQDGDEINQLDAACCMTAEFEYYAAGTTAEFEHQMAIMTFKFESSSRPAKLVFDNGSESYTVKYSTIEPVNGIYTSHIMINPCEASARTLTFTLYDAEGAAYDIRTVDSSKAYYAGKRYTSPVSDLDPTIWLGSGTEDDPYQITTADQLRMLSTNVNIGEQYSGEFFKMTNNIDLGGVDDTTGDGIEANEFTAIGNASNSFRGTFDGGGFEVSGLYINKPDDYYQGLFGYIYAATIKNLGVSGSVYGCRYVGGIVGIAGGSYSGATDSSIISCYNNAQVKSVSYYVGGVIGNLSISNSRILSCYNTGDVTSESPETSTYTGSRVGGIVGYAGADCEIGFCYNEGTITTTTSSAPYTGGIVGYMYSDCNVYHCYNRGEVNGGSYTGGIVGASYEGSSVYACYNSKSVSGGDYTGGIIGHTQVRGSSSYDGATIAICYNIGEVTSTSTYSFGGIAGVLYINSTLSNVYYSEDSCSKGAYIGAYTGATGVAGGFSAEYMQSEDFLVMLNNAAYKYNEDKSDEDKLYAWKQGADSYPDFDFENYPSYTEIQTDLEYDATTDTYLIPTADALRDFATKVTTEDNAIKGKLTEDIDLKNEPFTPIGNFNISYRGVFDGDGHKISNLYIDEEESSYIGLFGYIYNATIKNLGVSGSVTGYARVGGIVGYSYGSSITSCYSEVTVTGKGTTSTTGYTGGIVGYAQSSSSITSCYNTGAISGIYRTGGVAGYVTTTSVTLCYNSGAVTASNDNTGGIVGYASTRSTITACYNSGAITGSTSSSDHLGGLVGEIYSSSSSICSMGICYNSGTVSSTSTYRIGGAVGYNYGPATASDLYYLNTSHSKGIGSGSSTSFMAVDKSADEMSSDDFLLTLNNASATYNTDNADVDGAITLCAWKQGADGYPTFDYDNVPEYVEIKTELIYDESTETYQIPNAVALREFAAKVNSAETTIKGKLTASVDLNSEAFTPIGKDGVPFAGKFDGAGYEITGLYINDEESSYQGLFGSIENATIENVKVSGSVTGLSHVGGIAGKSSGSTINSCYSSVAVKAMTNYIGGITAYNYCSSIFNCANTGSVSIDPTSSSSSSYVYAGGIVGFVSNYYGSTWLTVVVNCYNSGSINAVGETVGGIVGYISSYTACELCYNASTITSNTTTNLGGVFGYAYSLGTTIETANNYYDFDLYSGNGAGSVYSTVTATSGVTTKSTSGMQTEYFAAELNNLAVEYNTAAKYSITLCGWKAVSGDYPTLDFGNTPVYSDVQNTDLVYNEDSSTYQIYTAAGLREFAIYVSSGNGSLNGELMNDIDLGGIDTTGAVVADNEFKTTIGASSSTSTYFKGTFDGGGHKVSGLYINSTTSSKGLFGYTYGAKIKNLGVSGTIIATGGYDIGGIVGSANASTSITSCYSDVAIKYSGTGSYVGGVVGDLYGSSVIACCNLNSVESNGSYTGGIAGEMSSTSNVTGCYNVGTITCSSSYRGGVIGSENTNILTSNYYLDTSCSRGSFSSSDGATDLTSANMQTEAFVAMLNNAANTYNTAYTSATQACAWKAVADGYPTFDYGAVPTYTEILDAGFDE